MKKLDIHKYLEKDEIDIVGIINLSNETEVWIFDLPFKDVVANFKKCALELNIELSNQEEKKITLLIKSKTVILDLQEKYNAALKELMLQNRTLDRWEMFQKLGERGANITKEEIITKLFRISEITRNQHKDH